jgi:hypothetical protein
MKTLGARLGRMLGGDTHWCQVEWQGTTLPEYVMCHPVKVWNAGVAQACCTCSGVSVYL